jgi:peptide/nickel transport system ATP-binding protein
VIPPDGYEIPQEEWRAVLSLTTRIDADDLSVEAVRAGLDDTSDENVARAIRAEHGVPEQLSDPEAEQVLSSSLRSVVESAPDPVDTGIAEAFASPCTTTNPELQSIEHGTAACHLFDEAHADASAAPHPVRGQGAED